MGCRKNAASLTPAERKAFVDAVLALKANGRYDTYISQHQGAMNHGHGGPAFFPWHREFLYRFERDLQSIDPGVNLPYWDWTVDNLNASGTESLIWRDDFMGGPGQPGTGNMTTGPFGGWGLLRGSFNLFQFPGSGGIVATAMTRPRYSDFRPMIEGTPHGGAHVWVGGDVGIAQIAVRDPVFWLIHSNADRLWAEWTNAMRGRADWVQFEPAAGGPAGHNLNDTMWPWNGGAVPFGVAPWITTPELRRPADLLEHRPLNTFYDTIDPECRAITPKPLLPKERLIKDRLPKENLLKERLPKERLIKERLPKENLLKERLPKERLPKEDLIKERLPKEDLKDRLPKEDLKEGGPKELKDIREVEGPKGIRDVELKMPPEGQGVFIPRELRPDLTGAGLGFEPDVLAELEDLQGRVDELGEGPWG